MEEQSNDEVRNKAEEFFLYGSPSLFNGGEPRPMPALFNPGAGIFAFTGATRHLSTPAPYTSATYNPLYNFADTLRWTKGAHAFRFGGELRITRSNGYNFLPYNLPRFSGGNGNWSPRGLQRNGAKPDSRPYRRQHRKRSELEKYALLLAGSVGQRHKTKAVMSVIGLTHQTM